MRGSRSATSATSSLTFSHSVSPGFDHGLEPLDQSSQPFGALDEHLQRLVQLGRRHLSALHRLGDAEDHGDRRAQLVADAPDQLLAVGGALQQGFLRELQLAGAAAFAVQRIGHLLDHHGGDLGGEHRATAHGLAHGVHDRVGVGALQDVSGGARNEHVADRALLLHAAERDHADVGSRGLQTACRLDPVHVGHPDVHQHDIGGKPPDELDRLFARACLADHFEVFAAQQEHQRLAEAVVVVDDEHADALGGAEGLGRAHRGSIGRHRPQRYPADDGFIEGIGISAR